MSHSLLLTLALTPTLDLTLALTPTLALIPSVYQSTGITPDPDPNPNPNPGLFIFADVFPVDSVPVERGAH